VFEVRVTKETENFLQALVSAPERFMREIRRAGDECGKHLETEAKKTIFSQPGDWPPLSAVYLKWKQKHGFDRRKLLRTYLMVNLIRYVRLSASQSGFRGFVTVMDRYYPKMKTLKKRHTYWPSRSVRATKKTSKSGTASTLQVATWHETGGGRSPKRSFFDRTAKREADFVFKRFAATLRVLPGVK
jgi:hypothetical protein